jgi:hypothetical protein
MPEDSLNSPRRNDFWASISSSSCRSVDLNFYDNKSAREAQGHATGSGRRMYAFRRRAPADYFTRIAGFVTGSKLPQSIVT